MDDFKITENKLPVIASELEADLDSVEAFLPLFEKFYEEVRMQHLASVMRALELHVRKKLNKNSFIVNWVISATNSPVAIGLRWDWGFYIIIPQNLTDLNQIRNIIAHELGHLFYAIEYPMNYADKALNQKMANVFGVFTMLNRNEFYREKAPQMLRSTWMQVVKDFKHQPFA